MFIYGKTAANAIAVMSFLAGRPGLRAGSSEIADARSLSRALTAKLLTQLAAAGLVRGQPGPGGGYMLAKNPADINLLNIVSLFEQREAPIEETDTPFEQTESPSLCPFGQGWCGHGPPCPLHETIQTMQEQIRKFLEDTRLSVFSPQKAPAAPVLTAPNHQRHEGSKLEAAAITLPESSTFALPL